VTVNWDDFRYVLAVARSGSAAAAGRLLKVNATTVSRRIQALEEELSAHLFDRIHNALVPTAAGHQAIASGERIESELLGLDATLKGRETEMRGVLRIASISALAELWSPDLAAFSKQHPKLELTVSVSNFTKDLSRREADVAIRLATTPPEDLIGKKYCEVFFAIYASKEFAAENFVREARGLSDVPWIGWEEPWEAATDDVVAEWAPGATVQLRINAMRTAELAIVDGLGVSVLPCFVGDRNVNLVRIGNYLEGGVFLWILTHPKLRRTTRVQTFRETAATWIDRDKALFIGQRPHAPTIPVPNNNSVV